MEAMQPEHWHAVCTYVKAPCTVLALLDALPAWAKGDRLLQLQELATRVPIASLWPKLRVPARVSPQLLSLYCAVAPLYTMVCVDHKCNVSVVLALSKAAPQALLRVRGGVSTTWRPSLETLRIASIKVDSDDCDDDEGCNAMLSLPALVPRLRHLTHMRLANGLGHATGAFFAALAHSTTISSLSLSSFVYAAADLRHLHTWVAASAESFFVDDSTLLSEPATSEALHGLCNALHVAPTLRHLGLDAAFADTFCRQRHTTPLGLTTLHLSSKQLQLLHLAPRLRDAPLQTLRATGAYDARPLLLQLRAMPRLTRLHVSMCHLGDAGCARLASALRNATSLRHVILTGNEISDIGARELATALPTTRMALLGLEMNRVTMVGALALVQKSHRGVALDLSWNLLSTDEQDYVTYMAASTTRAKIIFR
ncbi:hypothetical protein SDRG_09752 [Saprolegnia diclina VS20]|uniref:Uncharacterized protein n=1 Tax=Saprolegnia diclina (strain VS20) TaxID=1156394 RepID=T0QDF6_SAPDV|nr:hypothetical protein SDRG_09752 [Saprolegnia diclina VS20]EQC32781.1 hypothetical protein SDRG_09752 [Saprolegnia diclina VS20]|eukprot:XP_008613925.1 hypothetical protein SDRG_09752 [Saprolegnia diclina VS20]